MRLLPLTPAIAIVIHAAFTLAQSTPSAPARDGLELLKRVSQRYADAKVYALAATEEMSASSDFDHQWQKTTMAAAQAPEGRFYYEGHGFLGGAIETSDGKSVWKYHVEEDRYVVHAAAETGKESRVVPLGEMALNNARFLKDRLANEARTLRSASLMPEETLTIDGKSVPCLVVRVRNADENRPHPNADFEMTIWINKVQQTIVRTEEHVDQKHANGASGGPRTQVTTTTYTKTLLDEPLPDSIFRFIPPASAHQIAEFPDPRESMGQPSLAGEMIPALKFKSADGRTVALDSFRGKPLLLDFWATWCAPCVASMPKLAEIYKDAKDKGLVLVSVDQDEDAAKATDFLAKAGYTWPNFHDQDGKLEELTGSNSLPRVMLVDASGRIVYDGPGVEEGRLRMHLAQLGPEFKDMAAAPAKAPPSVDSK